MYIHPKRKSIKVKLIDKTTIETIVQLIITNCQCLELVLKKENKDNTKFLTNKNAIIVYLFVNIVEYIKKYYYSINKPLNNTDLISCNVNDSSVKNIVFNSLEGFLEIDIDFVLFTYNNETNVGIFPMKIKMYSIDGKTNTIRDLTKPKLISNNNINTTNKKKIITKLSVIK